MSRFLTRFARPRGKARGSALPSTSRTWSSFNGGIRFSVWLIPGSCALSRDPVFVRLYCCCATTSMPHERPRVPGAWGVLRKVTARTFARADGFLVHSGPLAAQVRELRPDAPVIEVFHPIYDVYAELGDAASEPTTRQDAGRISCSSAISDATRGSTCCSAHWRWCRTRSISRPRSPASFT